MERNPCVDTYSGSPLQCVAFIHIIVTGVVDVQLMSVEDHPNRTGFKSGRPAYNPVERGQRFKIRL